MISPAGEAFAKGCGKLSCPVCAPRKLRRYRARLARTDWMRMLTLTMPAVTDVPPGGDVLEVGIRNQAAAWSVLRRWLKRNVELKEYVWAREVTKASEVRPNLHMHVLLNSEYIPTKISRGSKSLLNDAIARAGFGPTFKINKVRGAIGYVTNYVSKCTQFLPRYARRFQTTVPDLRPRDNGWTFQRMFGLRSRTGACRGECNSVSVLRVCPHGDDRFSCLRCVDERDAREDAQSASRPGTQSELSLNLIPSRKKSVTQQMMEAGP